MVCMCGVCAYECVYMVCTCVYGVLYVCVHVYVCMNGVCVSGEGTR